MLPLAWALIALLRVTNYWWGLYGGYVAATSPGNAAEFFVNLLLPYHVNQHTRHA